MAKARPEGRAFLCNSRQARAPFIIVAGPNHRLRMSASLPTDISATVQRALAEDIGDGDLTAALIPVAARARGRVISREAAVLCGTAWVDEVFRQVGDAIALHWEAGDGESGEKDQLLCRLEGPARGLLTGERSALNFLQAMSGTATLARQYAE